MVRGTSVFMRHEWTGIIAALLLAYGGFCMVALAMGLDAADRLIAKAVWVRVRGAFVQ
jgi:hypothetical protein